MYQNLLQGAIHFLVKMANNIPQGIEQGIDQ
jgi:hypothetical protein